MTNHGKPKVVLYNPDAVFFTMPLALVALGSHLDRDRFDVVIIDGRLEDDPEGAVASAVDEALCLGVTVLTGAPIRDAVRISRVAKARRPDLPVVWGGWHPSMFGHECLEEPSVDVTVQGQGEETFIEIVERLARGSSLDGCLGCTYRADDGAPRSNGARPLAEVNGFGRHDYELIDVERYYHLKGKRQLDYISSQGCRFRCAFCADPFVYRRQWVGFLPERVGEEVGALWERYRFDDLSFQDETFFTKTARVDAIADEFLRRALPVTWAATLRADQSHRLPDDVFAKCARSGLRRVLIGVESGSPALLKRIKKDVTLDQVMGAAERCVRYDVAAIFPFIVGFPDETPDEVAASLEFAKRLRAMSPKFEIPIFYFKPYPGSAITQEAIARGLSLPVSLDEWSEFDFIGSAGPWVSREQYRLVERFKFYQHLAWKEAGGLERIPQRMARWRCRTNRFAWPVEMWVGRRFRKPAVLS
jgi:radical SAM superfamily enzyme YgiQ (UPF0313 family)